MIPVNIFISGNEERAKWHLPVVEAKFRSFVLNCQRRGLKQNSFQLNFEEDGTVAEGQYHYGTGSIQIYSPGKITTIQEESKDDLSVEVEPKTFWINTSKGYYWVEVRYTDGVPRVILTPFTAQTPSDDGLSVEWVYPGMELNAPGMLSGCFEDNSKFRYVVSQGGAVFTGEGEEKGTVISTEIIASSSRLTIDSNVGYSHRFILMTSDAKTTEARHLFVEYVNGEITVERRYLSAVMAYEGEGILQSSLLPNPCWVHRKCTGSYFSPNKTIGYHVDIGTDDDFWGNISALDGGLQDKLDNTAGFPEPVFNHTRDLYRFAPFLSTPISVSGDTVELVVCCPTMIYYNDPEENDKKCWGGYGITQTWASCVDYRNDFDAWMLAPRFIKCVWNTKSGEKEFSDFITTTSQSFVELVFNSWDDKFSASTVLEQQYSCDTKYHNIMEENEVDYCTWDEEITGNCDPGFDPVGYSAVVAKRWSVNEYWSYYTRENIKNIKNFSFSFGGKVITKYDLANFSGYYFLFDGLWHLDIGVHWSTAANTGNSCGIISTPLAGQSPGELVYFRICGSNQDWIAENGIEYVQNLNVITPLGYHIVPDGSSDGVGEHLCFIAEVPEELDAPTPPKVCIGGIRYPAQDIEGETVECERKIMSRPCSCSEIYWGPYANLGLNGVYHLYFAGGCPPFEWYGNNVTFKDFRGNKLSKETLEQTRSVYAHTGNCYASVSVTDACMGNLKKSASLDITAVVTGPISLKAGTQAAYYHNLGANASYHGTLEVVSVFSNGAVLLMPAGASNGANYTVRFSGECGLTASITVTAWACVYDVIEPCAWPGVGARVLCRDGNVRLVCDATSGLLRPSERECNSAHSFFWNSSGFFDRYFNLGYPCTAQRYGGYVVC
jgi:hypothetical protein